MDAKEYLIKKTKICEKHYNYDMCCKSCPLLNYHCGDAYGTLDAIKQIEKAIEIVKNYKLEDENNV